MNELSIYEYKYRQSLSGAWSLEWVAHAEGRVVWDESGNSRYEYALCDHLGNTHILFSDLDGDGKLTLFDDPSTEAEEVVEAYQESHYYPFGMLMEGPFSPTLDIPNNYLYNTKEFNADFGLDWYDYGARWYDPSIGRWGGVDPLAEQYYQWSPYNYTMNNPVRFVDPDGTRVYSSLMLSAHNNDTNDFSFAGMIIYDADQWLYDLGAKRKAPLYYPDEHNFYYIAQGGKNSKNRKNGPGHPKIRHIFRFNVIVDKKGHVYIDLTRGTDYLQESRPSEDGSYTIVTTVKIDADGNISEAHQQAITKTAGVSDVYTLPAAKFSSNFPRLKAAAEQISAYKKMYGESPIQTMARNNQSGHDFYSRASEIIGLVGLAATTVEVWSGGLASEAALPIATLSTLGSGAAALIANTYYPTNPEMIDITY